jgi:hypothetical protein
VSAPRAARFRILARLDGTRPQGGTVTVERAADMFAVRPLRRRRVYALPLSVVAQMVVERVIKAEIAAKRAEKRARRKLRKRS